MTAESKQESPWLVEFAKQKGEQTVAKLNRAMEDMELDIDNYEGIYPYNGGRINQAEVCRRAGIKNVTLQSKSHKATTKIAVDEWVKEINLKLVSGKRNVRKAVTKKVDEWKERHEQVCQNYRKDMLRLKAANIDLKKAKEEIARLTQENESLKTNISKILPFRQNGE